MVGACLQGRYHVTEAVQALSGTHMADSVEVVDVLTCYALLFTVSDLKAAQMNMQSSLIQELMLYKIEFNIMEATKNIS